MLKIPEGCLGHRCRDAFFLDRTEVTNGSYDECVRAGVCLAISTGGSDLPVTNVSWRDALAYCTWRGQRLPDPFEWQLAAGKPSRRYPWGDTLACDTSNWSGRWPLPPPDSGEPMKAPCARAAPPVPAPVGTFSGDATPVGVRDLGGNVAEIVQLHDPELAADDRSYRIGGAFDTEVDLEFRAITDATRLPDLGFRCAGDAR